jgi:hypothetical protein
MKTIINIMTYQRNEMLDKLLERIPSGVDVIIWDDDPNNEKEWSYQWHRFSFNFGKHFLWKKMQMIFEWNQKSDYDYFIFIGDDLLPEFGWVDELKKTWLSIDDMNKISLSFLTDKRTKQANWTDVEPIKQGEVILTHWNDLCFFCERRFINTVQVIPVNPDRWFKNPLASSGVGSMISWQMRSMGLNQYHTSKSLVKHLGIESKMNPEERKINPL